MSVWDRLRAAWMSGRDANPADVVDTITTREELDAYADGMKAAGKYSGDIAALIARRAERVSNRERGAADRYIAVHTALARGR